MQQMLHLFEAEVQSSLTIKSGAPLFFVSRPSPIAPVSPHATRAKMTVIAPETDPICNAQCVALGLQVVASCARAHLPEVKDAELKDLYGKLMTYCLLTHHHLDRIKELGAKPRCRATYVECLNQLVSHLKALRLPAADPIRRDNGDSTLSTLHIAWLGIRHEGRSTQVTFTISIFALDQGNDRLQALICGLQAWESDINKHFPEDQSLQIAEDASQRAATDETSQIVRRAAQSVSEALIACHGCSCPPGHQFGASLPLGTYQTTSFDENDNGIDFDMFLSTIEDWHEVHMHTVRSKAVQFAVASEERRKPNQGGLERRTHYAQPKKILRLCEPLYKVKPKRGAERFEFRVEKGHLYKLHSRGYIPVVDVSKRPVSLQQCLEGRRYAFTEKIKRILALVISYSVLHLHDTPWLHSTWSSSDIIFFHTANSHLPLRPYLQTQLSNMEKHASGLCREATASTHTSHDGLQSEDPDDDDDISHHPYPAVVSLAIILLEIHFAQTFNELAERFFIDLNDQASVWLHACDVFEACKHEIPGDSRLLTAVDQCLDPMLWQDDDGQKLDPQSIGETLFQQIVVPLQTDLERAFKYIPIKDLDQYIQKLDLSGWNQAIREEAENPSCATQELNMSQTTGCVQLQAMASISAPSLAAQYLDHNSKQLCAAELYQSSSRQTSRQPSPLPLALCLTEIISGQGEYLAHKFFDDETNPESHTLEARQGYARWHAQYQDVYNKFISSQTDRIDSANRVKIAILDTGVDLNHFDIQANLDRVKGRIDFVRGETGRRAQNTADLNGHGTFVTDIILQYAPDADVYVAKIADNCPSTPAIIAKAILHAINVWKVDMISMSFGFPSRVVEGYHELEKALKQAAFEDILVFAAASNSGGQLGRAFPARERNVICVHSTDNHGNRSSFSPTAVMNSNNVATVGEAVKAAWPSHLCPEGAEEDTVHKSGTSFATPIMVGIAAMLVLFVRIHLSPEKARLLKQQQQMENLLVQIATKTPNSATRGGYHFVDVSLHEDSLFGKDDMGFIKGTIEDVLRR